MVSCYHVQTNQSWYTEDNKPLLWPQLFLPQDNKPAEIELVIIYG